MLVHGGVGPEVTWEHQHSLADRWRLSIPWRRGYAGSPPADHQDFERDAADLAPILNEGAHVVGFSYGGLGAALLAGRDPARVSSLTLVEVPLYSLAGDDPEVRRMRELSDAFVAGRGGDPNAEIDATFLEMAGVRRGGGLDVEELDRLMRLARGLRPPIEAEPNVEAIKAAGMPVMVVSGGHDPRIERLCDLVSDSLAARRERRPGAGHAVPRAPGFNELLEDFLASAA